MPNLDELLELLKESKREHDHCDDCWYCCRACRNSDHGLCEGEHLGDGADTLSIGTSFKPGRLHVRGCGSGTRRSMLR